ncbi:MAG: S-methyl-5-thioribose-1-phosphate isomerase [Thermoprotei archaeon]
MLDLTPVKWEVGALSILDQRLLPSRVERLRCTSVEQVAEAIRTLAVRGAPTLGIVGGYSVALAAHTYSGNDLDSCIKYIQKAGETIKSTRPTARNLFWGVDRVIEAAKKCVNVDEVKGATLREAHTILQEEVKRDELIGAHGSKLIHDGDLVLTHCNTGQLATGGIGTALGVIRTAWEQGKRFKVFATETRPLLQGARLTTLELLNMGVPVTLIVDSAAGYLMRTKKVGLVVVGADRILADGSTANKIGTYTLAVLAKQHGVPFYVAAPLSTFDLESREITVEQRSPDEVRGFNGVRVAPDGVDAWNPAFDITPPTLISGIITEKGVLEAPFEHSIRKAFT